MTDWATEYRRDPSFAREMARDILYGNHFFDPMDEALIESVAALIRARIKEELESVVEQIKEYPISEDEIERMSAEIRSLYQ